MITSCNICLQANIRAYFAQNGGCSLIACSCRNQGRISHYPPALQLITLALQKQEITKKKCEFLLPKAMIKEEIRLHTWFENRWNVANRNECCRLYLIIYDDREKERSLENCYLYIIFFRVVNDSKVKKTPPSYSKKTSVPPPNHHSTPLYPTPDSYYEQKTSSNFDLGSRHGERSSLESNYKKKRDKDKEKERERPRGENEFPHLPDVPGAEGIVWVQLWSISLVWLFDQMRQALKRTGRLSEMLLSW